MDKAAVYLDAFARGHCFVDGNKRIALQSAALFLAKNGFLLRVTAEEAELFLVQVITEHLGLGETVQWLARHTSPEPGL